jgi:hypothetical protein
MAQTGSITVMAHGEPADQLLACLRARVAAYNVGTGEPDGPHVLVTNSSGSVDDLQRFLDAHLDQCAQQLGVPNRRDHLLVDPQQPR